MDKYKAKNFRTPLYRVFRALFSEIYDPRFGDQTGAASARMLYALSLFRKK